MSLETKGNPLNIMEYYDWVKSQRFRNTDEHHQYVPYQEQDFLQNVIYPMFYNSSTQFETSIPFPMVLKNNSTKKPIYVIDNDFFTIVFFSYDNNDDETCWKLSMHIKNHDFCDERIQSFRKWFAKYCCFDIRFYDYGSIGGFPKEFTYHRLILIDDDVRDFGIEFWNKGRDFKLFKLLDLLRLF